jgi:hypothetical protein
MLQRLPAVTSAPKPPKPATEAPVAKAPAADEAPAAAVIVLPPCPPPAAALRPVSCWNTKGTWEEVRVIVTAFFLKEPV